MKVKILKRNVLMFVSVVSVCVCIPKCGGPVKKTSIDVSFLIFVSIIIWVKELGINLHTIRNFKVNAEKRTKMR